MKHLVRFIALCFLLPLTLVAQEGVSFYAEGISAEEFAQRRERVLDEIGPNAIAVMQGAPSPRGYTRFRQSNEFYYLTGIKVPHAYLVLDGSARTANLYLPHENARRERGEGDLLSAEDAEKIVSERIFSNVFGSDVMGEHVARLAQVRGLGTIYTLLVPAEGLSESRDLGYRVNLEIASDPWDGQESREGRFANLLRMRLPTFSIKDISPIIDELRLIKSEAELDLIRKATRLSGLALLESMRSTEPGQKEYELDAVAKFIYYREGAQGDAYYSLIASASNAYYPHYNAGTRTMNDGDFLLMDYAPDYQYYMSDVTRMWPVNGKFAVWQKELYGFYVGCYRSILNHIGPGKTAQAIRQAALTEMESLLSSTQFSKPEYQRAAQAFVFSYRAGSFHPSTSLGHYVGMATHDVGRGYEGVLKPGMVFTIEPALRVPEEQIYIRLEDLIIITEDGAEIVSDFVPMDIEGIEKVMSEPGILQKFPDTVQSLFARDQ